MQRRPKPTNITEHYGRSTLVFLASQAVTNPPKALGRLKMQPATTQLAPAGPEAVTRETGLGPEVETLRLLGCHE